MINMGERDHPPLETKNRSWVKKRWLDPVQTSHSVFVFPGRTAGSLVVV